MDGDVAPLISPDFCELQSFHGETRVACSASRTWRTIIFLYILKNIEYIFL